MRISFFGSLRPSPPRSTGLVYRLRQWPAHLPETLHTADVLRALSVMSHRPVSREWIERQFKLRPAAVDELLALLQSRGELDVVDTSKFSPAA